MAEHPDSGSPEPRFTLRRRELPPTRRERLLRIALRVVTIVLLAGALGTLALDLVRHGH